MGAALCVGVFCGCVVDCHQPSVKLDSNLGLEFGFSSFARCCDILLALSQYGIPDVDTYVAAI